MARPLFREFLWVALLGAAVLAAHLSLWAGNRIDCDENGTPALLFLGLGAGAVIAALRVFGARLRWGIALAIPYALVVYSFLAADAIGNCTS